MARYGKKAQEKVEKAMHERKRGTLRSGGSGKKVKSRKQAIAIGLSEAREEGGKVPRQRAKPKKSATRRRSSAKKSSARSSAKKSSRGRTSARKSTSKRATAKTSSSRRSAGRSSSAKRKSPARKR